MVVAAQEQPQEVHPASDHRSGEAQPCEFESPVGQLQKPRDLPAVARGRFLYRDSTSVRFTGHRANGQKGPAMSTIHRSRSRVFGLATMFACTLLAPGAVSAQE